MEPANNNAKDFLDKFEETFEELMQMNLTVKERFLCIGDLYKLMKRRAWLLETEDIQKRLVEAEEKQDLTKVREILCEKQELEQLMRR